MQVEARGPTAVAEHSVDHRKPDFASLRRIEYARLDQGGHYRGYIHR